MNAEDFYKSEDVENNKKYDISDISYWYFGKEEMILFAEEYAKQFKEKSENYKSVLNAIRNLADKQTNLDPEFAKIFHNNIWDLI